MPRAENHLKILENLSCRSITYHKDIIDATCSKGHDPLLQKFTEKFYSYLPVDYTSKDRLTTFASIAKDAYEFYHERNGEDNKIDVFSSLNNDEQLLKNNSNFLTIKILSSDKPFIVDSLKCLFARSGIRPKFLFHPVIKADRDISGKLIALRDSGAQESLIYIKIYGNYNKEFVEYIRNAITDILSKVSSTFDSWSMLLAKLNEVNSQIKDNNEVNSFLDWLKADNFTFLGYTKIGSDDKIIESIGDAEICNSVPSVRSQKFVCDVKSQFYMFLGQVNKISPVHKDSFIDYVRIKIGDNEHVFLGLYGSAVYYQSVKSIPILREKMLYVLNNSGFNEGGYNAKKLRSIIESLPRETLFQMDNEHLYCLCLHVLSAMVTKNIKVFVQVDNSGEFISILTFLPRDRLTPEVHNNINQYLTKQFDSHILSDYITEIEQNFCYLYVTLNLGQNLNYENIEMDKIEDDIDSISSEWEEALVKALLNPVNNLTKTENNLEQNTIYTDNNQIYEKAGIFPKDYQQKTNIKTALSDLLYIEKLTIVDSSVFNLQIVDSANYILKIYSYDRQSLFNLMPIIENLGFKAIDEQIFELNSVPKKIWLYEFNLVAEHIPVDAPVYVKERVEDALMKMHSGDLLSDSLCKMVVLEGFNWRQVMILKALTRYLHQTNFTYGKGYVQLVLVQHHEYTSNLLKLFECMFDPNKVDSDKVNYLNADMNKYLISVVSSAEDKVLRSMLEVFKAIVRTNAYSSTSKNYISFKLDSSKVPGLPLPIPYAEIFVYSNDFEGIHLRGGKVARGGLRWSDRGEDYRTEVLGLMKAQTTKNTVIVPMGSKGGFFIKFSEEGLTRPEYMAKVVECYKAFLRGLLDLTDNIIESKVVQPNNMVIYDNEDPYLVVAADKGTASFSDYANSVSAEYNFWLGDAFASGGSAGYDHKKMAITSRGAWISVVNHFASMGIDVQKDPVTVLGIGDMSGDVFGNGMLRSSSIKLVAAFNHMHIFLDPNPNAKSSFEERKRLFDLPNSKWTDYDQKLISKGGGVFERSAKKIILTSEVQTLLGTSKTEAAPEELINIFLKAKVDLLWNGGIGTYIKATEETHLDIGDKANDNLRCNGKDVGAKVIGEGGNLGVSQRGRIEYCKNGGKLNTDFIDNSAGVDCSDHEVNIKIVLNSVMAKGKLRLEERNILLAGMTDQIASLVLNDNFQQNQALNIAEKSSAFTVEMFSRLIDSMEKSGLLNRDVEFLPTLAEFGRRTATGEKMTRPELAVLLSYSKMSVYNEILTKEVLNDKYFEKDLIDYFPLMMQKDFHNEIMNHPLRKEIIATIITNKIVNTLSGPLVDTIIRETDAQLCDIVRSYFIVYEIFNLAPIWVRVERLSNIVSSEVQTEMFTELGKVIRRGISWFMRNLNHPINVSNAVAEYSSQIHTINKIIPEVLLGSAKDKFEAKTSYFATNKVDADFAQNIAMLDSLVSSLDILITAQSSNADNSIIAKLYFEVSERFNIDYLRKCSEKLISDSYWNRLSIQAIKDDLYDKQRRLLLKIINDSDCKMNVEHWYAKHQKQAHLFMSFIEDLKLQENIDINMMILANKKFEIFLRRV